MANPSLALVQTLRNAARKLEGSTNYQWGHMGTCNCGYLVQEVTKLTKEEIHSRAMMRQGDWSEQLNDYCATSGLPMDAIISKLISFGFETGELQHLERLSDPKILFTLPYGARHLHFNIKEDVVTYMKGWANLLEEELLKDVTIPTLQVKNRYRIASSAASMA